MHGRESRWIVAASLVCLLGLAGTACEQKSTQVELDNPQLDAFVELIMPARIEIQHYLTRPFDFSGTGDADGLEVVLSVHDSFDDPVKCVGTFHFELYKMRMASGDKRGQRVDFWQVTIDADDTLVRYWDRVTRFYRFELQRSEGKLPPGRYILSVRLVTPTDKKLVDEYELAYGVGG